MKWKSIGWLALNSYGDKQDRFNLDDANSVLANQKEGKKIKSPLRVGLYNNYCHMKWS